MSLQSQFARTGELAAQLINAAGTTVIFTPKSTGVPVTAKAFIKELGNEELVADYRQGDLRVEIDATKVPGIPMKYDVLTIDGKNYTAVDPSGAPRRAGDIVYAYKFVVRGS